LIAASLKQRQYHGYEMGSRPSCVGLAQWTPVSLDPRLKVSTTYYFYFFFYEKVIKVKADVAAVLNYFSPSCIDLHWVTWGAVKGAAERGRSS